MPVTAVLHTETRVVRRLTTDFPALIAPDETAVDVTGLDINLSGGFTVLELDNSLRPASPEEALESGVDEAAAGARRKTRHRAASVALGAAAADPLSHTSLREALTKLRLAMYGE